MESPTDQEANSHHLSLHLDNFPDQSHSNSLSPKIIDSQEALDPQPTRNRYPSTSEVSNIIPLRSLPSTHGMLNSKTSTQAPISHQNLYDSLDFEIDPSKDSRQDFHHQAKPSIFKSQHHEKLRKLKKAASQDLDAPFPDPSPSDGQQLAQSQKIFFPDPQDQEEDEGKEQFQSDPQPIKKPLQPQKSWTHLSVVAKALSKFKAHRHPTALNSRQYELLHELNPEQRKGSKITTKGYYYEKSPHKPEGRCWFFKKGLPRKEKMAVLKQQLKEPISPNGKFRFIWDIIVMLTVLADMIVLPLQISFGVFDTSNKFNYFCLVIFTLDIFFNFHTAYYKHGNLITSHAKIAKRYLRTWFIIDFLAAFPFFLFGGNINVNENNLMSSHQQLLTALRLVKILRLFRLFKLRPILYKFRIFFGSAKTQGPYELIRLLIVALIFAHWLACSWHLLAVYEIEYIHSATTWLEEKNLLDADAYTRYLYSLYWAIATMLTVGYGDIVPVSTPELWFTICAMLIGCGIFAYVLSTIGNIIREHYQEKANLRSSIHTINRFMNKHSMSKDVQNKLQGYIEYLLEEESHKKKDQEEFLRIIPESIKRQVLVELNGRLLTHHVIFSSNFNEAFLVDLATKLKERVLGPQEEIFHENENEDNFYFVVKGKIELYIDRTRQVVKLMGTGDYFGEIPFFSNSPKTLSAISCFYSHVFFLKKKTFLKRLLKHPSQRESYCYMKDQIDLYKDYSSVKTKCFACDDPHHTISECSQVLYFPDYQNIIHKINQEERTFMKNFVRKPIRHFHALGHQPEIVSSIEKIQENSSINLPFSRLFMQRKSSIGSTGVKRRRSRSRDSFNRSPSPEAIREIPSHIEEDAVEVSKNGEILKLDELSDVENSESEEERDEEWRQRRRQRKKDMIVFDSVKIFNKYFPHNNVDNIIKRLNRLNEIHKLTPQNNPRPGPKHRKSLLMFLGKKPALKNPFPSLANLDDVIPELPELKSGSDKQVNLRIDSKLGPNLPHHKSHHPPLTAKLEDKGGKKSAEDSPKSAATELGRVHLSKL